MHELGWVLIFLIAFCFGFQMKSHLASKDSGSMVHVNELKSIGPTGKGKLIIEKTSDNNGMSRRHLSYTENPGPGAEIASAQDIIQICNSNSARQENMFMNVQSNNRVHNRSPFDNQPNQHFQHHNIDQVNNPSGVNFVANSGQFQGDMGYINPASNYQMNGQNFGVNMNYNNPSFNNMDNSGSFMPNQNNFGFHGRNGATNEPRLTKKQQKQLRQQAGNSQNTQYGQRQRNFENHGSMNNYSQNQQNMWANAQMYYQPC
jgi:hypothetical protein